MPFALPFRRPAGAPARKRSGIHIQRLGGAPVRAVPINLPRVGTTLAVRCFVLFARPRRAVVLRMDGHFLRRVPLPPAERQPDGRGRQVANIWLDLSELPLGTHRITVEPSGPLAWFHRRGRRFVRVAPEFLPDTDASLPLDLGPDLEQAVAALPSVARPARRVAIPGPIRSILIVRADQLGDLVVSIPAVQRLRSLFADAKLTLLCTAGNADFAHATGLFDTILPITYPGTLAPEEQARIEPLLRAERFDIALDLSEGGPSRLLLLLSGARFTYGFRHGDHSWLSASFELQGRDPGNALEWIAPSRKLLAMVEALGPLTTPPPQPVLPLSPDPQALAVHGLRPDERYLVIHAGARLAYNRWPHMAALVRQLLERTDLPLLIFLQASDDVPTDLPESFRRRLRVVEGLLPFAEFDALLGNAAVVVGNDSGPKHLAAVRGAKVVSLHVARLNWNEWGQEGEGLILSRRVPCAGCGIGPDPAECGRGFPCLTGITPDEVCAAVLSLL